MGSISDSRTDGFTDIVTITVSRLTAVLFSVTLFQSRSSRDAFARALSEAERVRCLRAGLQPAPGRLWASFPSVLRPRREVLSLDWDRMGRVTPAGFRRA
jgi:hypothetical protein